MMDEWTEEFTEVYKKYYNDVFKIVHHKISNTQAAEDITQDTFFAAFKLGRDFLEHPAPKRWLLRTAHNKMLELYRKTKRWGMEPLEKYQELAAQDCHYGEVELNVSALATISEEDWRTLKAYHVFGTTMAEIAKSKSITENNMRVRMYRVKKKLKDEIEY